MHNRIFKFTASVKLAIPLMLVLGTLVAAGTIVESRYNSEYAKLTIYNSWWFMCLLVLLFINILNSTLSRLPWRRKHLGFVVTHIGLLTLLTGAMMTALWGVDGQLRVSEGSANSVVVLPRLMLSYRLQGSPNAPSVIFDKSLSERRGSSLDFINDRLGHVVRAEGMLPFATIQKTFVTSEGASDDVALSFILRSQFFNVSEWLQSKDNPEMQLGPATLRLIKDSAGAERPAPKPQRATASTPAPANALVKIKNTQSGAVVAQWSLKKNHFEIQGVKFVLKKKFTHATVAKNRIEENPQATEPNPALEVEISKEGQTEREILFAKYANFSLHKNGVFGYSLEFVDGDVPAAETPAELPAGHPSARGAPPSMAQMGSHVVEFHVDPKHPTEARVRLLKDGKEVGRQTLAQGQSFQTPWMGMKVFLGEIQWGSTQKLEAQAVEPQRGQDLPPSAIELHEPGAKENFWLSEGDTHSIRFANQQAEVYFGRETLDLPFQVKLEKFSKMDYPGTQTPMSFESDVTIDGEAHKISMNEPLKKAGYTIYQASYMMNEKGPPDSIFSINRDPGRSVKYSGSLILAIGIILFTITRSRWYQRRFGAL